MGVAVAGGTSKIIVVDAGQRVDRIDAVRGQRRDRGVRGRHLQSGGAAFGSGFRFGLRSDLGHGGTRYRLVGATASHVLPPCATPDHWGHPGEPEPKPCTP